MSDRGMKKWAPFSSLIEQAKYLEEMKIEKNKITKPQIASDLITKINQILSNYHNEEVTIKYFDKGYIHEIKGIIKKINNNTKEITILDNKIKFNDILDIDSNEYSNNLDNFNI